jgi:hypothetical protein
MLKLAFKTLNQVAKLYVVRLASAFQPMMYCIVIDEVLTNLRQIHFSQSLHYFNLCSEKVNQTQR